MLLLFVAECSETDAGTSAVHDETGKAHLSSNVVFTWLTLFKHRILVLNNPISLCSGSERPQNVIWGI